MFVYVLVFELRKTTDIDLDTKPYHAAVISSSGYPGNDTTFRPPAIYIFNMDLGVYVTFTLITDTQLHFQAVKVSYGSEIQEFSTLSSPFSIKYQERLIEVKSEYYNSATAQGATAQGATAHPVFLVFYEGILTALS